MELNDCAFPTLAGVNCTDSMATGLKDVDYAMLVGAKARGPGNYIFYRYINFFFFLERELNFKLV